MPDRPAPIKQETVVEYILEAAREEYSINWVRFCEEIGLTKEIAEDIQGAVSKVGRERLKSIKNELPDSVRSTSVLSMNLTKYSSLPRLYVDISVVVKCINNHCKEMRPKNLLMKSIVVMYVMVEKMLLR